MTDFIEPSAFSIHYGIILMAFLLDIAIGDPKWLPHPVRIMGRSIAKTETLLRKSEVSSQKSKVKLKGIVLVFIIVGLTFGLTTLIVYFLIRLKDLSTFLFFLSSAFMIYLTATTIALHELIKSAKIVIESIKNKDLDSARKNLSMIVGRDTQNLSEKGILKAVIETLSENLSDGIIAPLFYLTIGGLPLAMTYKAINTLDSMVGYKNERYKDFGWAAAKLDDIANYIPARISGVLISFASLVVCRSLSNAYCSLRTMVKDGKKHLSPNAGMPEAAIAGALGVQLGGPSTYSGMVIQKPYIGIERTDDYLTASEKAIEIIKVASTVGVITIGVYLYAK
jgi:adenosylcobinamide-phosphate synthase